MYEVDFLSIEKTGELGSKSGDAIAVRFTEDATGQQRIVVVDGGYKHTGDRLVEHIQTYYETDHVDLVISTHPDMDHVNGLVNVLTDLTVGELMIHIPHDHAADATDFSNIEVIDALIALAEDKGITVTEPFTGLTRFGGQLRILSPTRAFYEEQLAENLEHVRAGLAPTATAAAASRPTMLTKAADLLERTLAALPFLETLGENGDTGPRNETSAVTLLNTTGRLLLLTGDAGINALTAACDEFELQVSTLPDTTVDFFQAPHHGSKHNLSPSVLNRLFGKPGDGNAGGIAYISSAKQDPKHPSPKVTNALARRGLQVFATEGRNICHHNGAPTRDNWVALTPIGPLDEDDD